MEEGAGYEQWKSGQRSNLPFGKRYSGYPYYAQGGAVSSPIIPVVS